MNVLEVLIAAMAMQLATTLKEVTPALATLDTQAMGFLAQVSAITNTLFSFISIDASGHHLTLNLQNEYDRSQRWVGITLWVTVHVNCCALW